MSDEESTGSFQDTESNQEIYYLRNSARGYRGALTRRINTSKRHLKTAGDDPNSYIVADLLRSKDEVQKAFQKLEDAYILVQAADASSFQECEDALDTEAKQMNEVIEKINIVLMKSTHPAGVSPLQRKLDLFRSRQEEGQTFSAWSMNFAQSR